MTTLRSRIVGWVGRKYFARKQKQGFDLSKMPLSDETLLRLKRYGLDPVAQLAATREREPFSRLPWPFGMRDWLVSGYDEANAVHSDVKSFSNDFSNLVGDAGVSA